MEITKLEKWLTIEVVTQIRDACMLVVQRCVPVCIVCKVYLTCELTITQGDAMWKLSIVNV